MNARLRALCEGDWERQEQRSAEGAPDYKPPPRPGSLDDPMGPTEWDRRTR